MTATGYRAAMLVARMAPFTSTIFAEMSALAVRTGAINLGQGFPDTDGPASLLADVAANVTGGVNQYPPGSASPRCARPSRSTRSASTASTSTPTTC